MGNTGKAKQVDQAPRHVRASFVRCQEPVVFINGAWSSVTSDLHIHMALYAEHVQVPSHQDITVNPDGRSVVEPGEATVELIREIQAEVAFAPEVARAIINMLEDRIKFIEEHRQSAAQPKTTEVA